MNVRESLNRSFQAAISKTIKTKFNEDFSSSEEPGTESTRKQTQNESEIERQGWREKKSNRVMPRARKFESREKYYIDGKKEKNLAF